MDNAMDVEKHGIQTALEIVLNEHNITGKVIIVQCDNVHALQSVVKEYTPRLKAAGAKFVKAKHVKAHTSHNTSRTKVNAIVDALARKEMEFYRKQFNKEEFL